MTATSIHNRALLIYMMISTWTARKLDRKVTEDLNRQHHATSDATRVNKLLLPGDCPSYKSLITIAGSIRQQHYGDTLAWSDEGWRLLPTANYMQYMETFRRRKAEFDSALETFVAEYPALKAHAKIRLNGLYKEEDYPSALDVRSRFALGVECAPVPAQGDIRVDLGSDQISAIEAGIQDRVQRAVQIAVQDAWSRLHVVVSKISEKLNTPDDQAGGIFRDSLIENASELCDVLKRLNVTSDPNLESMRQRVLKELTRYQPDTLRTNAHTRATVASAADKILRDMQAFYAA